VPNRQKTADQPTPLKQILLPRQQPSNNIQAEYPFKTYAY
jgi:hypothetical protein